MSRPLPAAALLALAILGAPPSGRTYAREAPGREALKRAVRDALEETAQEVARTGQGSKKVATLGTVGRGLALAGDRDAARRRLSQAFSATTLITDAPAQVEALADLADHASRAGDCETARQCWREGLGRVSVLERPHDFYRFYSDFIRAQVRCGDRAAARETIDGAIRSPMLKKDKFATCLTIGMEGVARAQLEAKDPVGAVDTAEAIVRRTKQGGEIVAEIARALGEEGNADARPPAGSASSPRRDAERK